MMVRWSREDALYVPQVLAALSLVYLVGRRIWAAFKRDKGKAGDPEEASIALDGLEIFIFRLVRLLTIFVLLSLEFFNLSAGQGLRASLFQPLFYLYASILAILTVSTPARWRDAASRLLSAIMFVEFVVYCILDIWPYATYYLEPVDSSSDPVTWVRIAMLAFSGLVIPLVMPRPFRPMRPGAKPGIEDTVSLLSLYSFSFLDNLVFYANKVGDVTPDDMPELVETDEIEHISKRARSILDPVGNKNRHVMLSTAIIWRKELSLGALWLFLQSIAQFASPFGLKNLLEYLETGTSAYGLRPWVWIVVLTVGPIAAAIFFVWYLYLSSIYSVELTSTFTYLVFQHALRIRFKSDSAEEEKEKKSDEVPTDAAATPSTADVDSSAVSRDTTEVESESRAETDTLVGEESSPAKEGQSKERAAHLTGKINNLLTGDLTTITESFNAVAIPVAFVQLALSTVFLYNLLNWSAFVGLVVMLSLFPIPVYIGKLMSDVQRKKMQATDKRVQAATEYLGILRMIKLFAWVSYTLKNIEKHRDEELNELKKSRFLQAALGMSNEIIPVIAKIIVIMIYLFFSKEEFRASRIFSAIMVFSMMEERMYHIMYQLPGIIKNKVSFDRYTEFFNKTEILTDGTPDAIEGNIIIAPEFEGEPPIGFKACSFSWDAFTGSVAQGKRRKRNTRDRFELRFDDEISFKRGAINLIIGPTASGKTSVLMALLGEMYYKPHGVGSWHSLPREGGVAYAPQETWVLNDTIRENILFGEPYDEVRYKKALAQSALERDLNLWEAGDLTEVGEKGLTLSGGQKARVTLARALYSSASILLLDDVLAALDVHTAKWVVNEALTGDLVKGRTVLLVTHSIALAAPIADYALVLGRNGKVASHGDVAEVLQRNSRLRSQMEKERLEIGEDVETKLEETTKDDSKNTDASKKTAGKLVVAEEKAMGRVNSAAVMLFIGSMGGPLVWTGIIGAFWFSILVMIFQGWFLGYWSNQYTLRDPSDVPTMKFLIIYAVANLTGPTTDVLAQVFWVLRSIKASKSIHVRLLTSIFTSTFRWLDITPVGRIITRCTQDMNGIDDRFSSFGLFFMYITLNSLSIYAASVWMVGLYALIPGLVVFALGGALGLVYLKCQVSVRREMSNAKAPVMSQVGTALSGLPSIRAYGAQELFDVEIRKRINKYTRTGLTFYHINRWISVRIDILGAIFSGIVSTYLVYGDHLEAGYAGFTLNIVLSFTRQILVWVRIYNMLEIEANSLERMRDYIQIDHEQTSSESGNPPAYWPASGELRVEKLSARYSDDSPDVLREVSFSVKSGERVGIVGRTGAGKSSVALALLRALKTSGKVYYDGLATDEINLDALRSKITLIPQQPELMHGTLRENLDPFSQHDDALLNDALRSAGLYRMKEFTDSSAETVHDAESSLLANNSKTVAEPEPSNEEVEIGLDTMVESGGTNFSLGQRQIIALARAIVRRSKLLILDEATASIDYATDVAIQKTLRTEVTRDTTILTIAHRLQTIIDYDKILVLDAGKLVEFDSPKALLEHDKGYFRSLVDESDERETLYRLVRA